MTNDYVDKIERHKCHLAEVLDSILFDAECLLGLKARIGRLPNGLFKDSLQDVVDRYFNTRIDEGTLYSESRKTVVVPLHESRTRVGDQQVLSLADQSVPKVSRADGNVSPPPPSSWCEDDDDIPL